ncbi:hypothetical protein HNO88_004240 [Novosphingobium chloroacetimidivorans]|uniref:Uncharacterized protein n=1 Tax=Novosphingobium chloroacetimidivorans TaxID=1428314 RepID=A0A7W7KDK9_9SPHN|nr:hypothetical protein [Novosphingobium chloroacetimidivorans]
MVERCVRRIGGGLELQPGRLRMKLTTADGLPVADSRRGAPRTTSISRRSRFRSTRSVHRTRRAGQCPRSGRSGCRNWEPISRCDRCRPPGRSRQALSPAAR